MNWLIYIGGWLFGSIISVCILGNELTEIGSRILYYSWTVLWVGLCWRIK